MTENIELKNSVPPESTGSTTETENAVLPEQTTRALAQGKEPIIDGIPKEMPKALLEV